jgi:hypothetical protein
MDETTNDTAQARFERLYITSTEICRDLQVARAVVLQARRRGQLPNGISVNGGALYLWERTALQPYLDAWRISLRAHRTGVALA